MAALAPSLPPLLRLSARSLGPIDGKREEREGRRRRRSTSSNALNPIDSLPIYWMWSRGLRQPPQHFTPLFFLRGSSAGPIKNPRKIMVAFKQPAIFPPSALPLRLHPVCKRGERVFTTYFAPIFPAPPLTYGDTGSPERRRQTAFCPHGNGGGRSFG